VYSGSKLEECRGPSRRAATHRPAINDGTCNQAL